MRSNVLTLSDGRTLSWAELGSDSSGNVLLHDHGTGSCRLELALYDDVFAELDLRVIAPERPGYGFSTADRTGRAVADWADDISALLAELSVETFAVSGFSGGGSHALALAAGPALAERVSRVLLRAAYAPDQEARHPREAETRDRAGCMSWRDFEGSYATLSTEETVFAPADADAFADPAFAEATMATLAEGARQSASGSASDHWALARPWGFELAAVTQPVEIWHGDADTVVPVSHAHSLFARLPDATLRVLPHDGHFSIGRRVPEQLASLTTA